MSVIAVATAAPTMASQPEASTATAIVEQLGEAIDLVLDGGPAHGGPPSTVVDCTVDPPRILRAGAVDVERVRAVLGRLE